MAPWPPDYAAQLTGSACPLCAEGRPDHIGQCWRFYASPYSDAYLHGHGVQRGYVVVIWRGRHVVEPTELTMDEAQAFWADAMRVSRTMQQVYQPLKMNYQLPGNRVAHLHWILAPRFVDDIAPGDPLPGSGYQVFPVVQVQAELAQLRAVLAYEECV